MDENLDAQIQESLAERAKIEKLLAEREKKDKHIISMFCATTAPSDMFRTLELLEKYTGMPKHDKKTVEEFKNRYPDELTVLLISDFSDVKDMYSKYLESGGEDYE